MEHHATLYDGANPLDNVEEVLDDYNWIYSRMNNEALVVEVEGKSCAYRLLFIWQEHLNALQICCQYNLHIRPHNMERAALAIMEMNTSLWMGHFEIMKDSASPCFRHTCLIHEHDDRKDYTHIENLLDISLIQCERYQNVFHLLAGEDSIDTDILSFAMMETAGES